MHRITALAITIAAAASLHAEVTYSKEIARLIAAKCQGCHREGDIAPFTLGSYTEVGARLRSIKSAVESGRMPPWKPAAGPHAFRGNYGLTDSEKTMVLEWIAAGAPEGDPEDLPSPAESTGEWQLGDPDAVVSMPQSFSVPPGSDTYRCFALPYELSSRKWLRALQVAPGNRTTVHHVLLFLDPNSASVEWDGADGNPGYNCFGSAGRGIDNIVGAWAPGLRANFLPDGIGIPLPSRGRLVMQVHYHPHGDHHGADSAGADQPADTDQTKVALYFTPAPPDREIFFLPLLNDNFKIPAGSSQTTVRVQVEVPSILETDLLIVGPHMHLLGRDIKVEKLPPAPSTEAETLIHIPDWDFTYQSLYTFEKEVHLGPLSRVRLSCTYDNSDSNPNNPSDPPKDVTYGESTTDEMCLSFLGVVFPQGLLNSAPNRINMLRNSISR